MILRDNGGSIIFFACRSIRHCSGPLQAELLACHEGLNLALQSSSRYNRDELHGCTQVDQVAQSRQITSYDVSSGNQKSLAQWDSSIACLSRNQNIVSHALAGFGSWEGQ